MIRIMIRFKDYEYSMIKRQTICLFLLNHLFIYVKNHLAIYLQIPVYDFKTNSRVPDKFTVIYPSDVVLVEGILIFYYARMR